jgi:hypothetical protein
MVQLAVEDSKAAWKVLIEVLRGNSTMTAVKKSLKITHPSALEQLQRLEKKNYISGERLGRQKFYTMNWSGFRQFLLLDLVKPKTEAKVQNVIDSLGLDKNLDHLIERYFRSIVLGGVLNFVVELSVDGEPMSIEDIAKTNDDPFDYERIVEEARKNMLDSEFSELYKKNEYSLSTIKEAMERFLDRMISFSNSIMIDIKDKKIKEDDLEPEFFKICMSLDVISKNMKTQGIYRDVLFEKLVQFYIKKKSKEVIDRTKRFFGR